MRIDSHPKILQTGLPSVSMPSPTFSESPNNLRAPFSSLEINLSKNSDAQLADLDYFFGFFGHGLVDDFRQKYQGCLQAIIAVISPTLQPRRRLKQAMYMENNDSRSLHASGSRLHDQLTSRRGVSFRERQPVQDDESETVV